MDKLSLVGQTVVLHLKSGIRTIKINKESGEHYKCIDLDKGTKFDALKCVYDAMFGHMKVPIKPKNHKGPGTSRTAHIGYRKSM